MAGWHHRLGGHDLEQTPGVGDGQGGLACCGPWGHKESDTTERLSRTECSMLRLKPPTEELMLYLYEMLERAN